MGEEARTTSRLHEVQEGEMGLRLALDILALVFATLTYVQLVRERRKVGAGCEVCAQKAIDALSDPNIVDGIRLPDPNDERWRMMLANFGGGLTGLHKETVLRLGNVTVRCTMPLVYIGFDGEALDGGELYAKRVIQAHRQRVVDQAVS